mgnify:CR=1 FL=1
MKRQTRNHRNRVLSCVLIFVCLFILLTEWLCFQLDVFDVRKVFDFKNVFLTQNNELIKEDLNQKDDAKENIDTFPKVTKLSLVMVGDALFHTALYEDGKTENGYDFKEMLSFMKPIISSYDLAFYNQESILGGSDLGLSSYPRFNSPYEVGDAFLDAGFNMVSLANNHTLDRGEEAILNSVSYWKKKGIMYHGSASSWDDRNQVKVMEKNGIRYVLLSYTDYTNDIPVPVGQEYLVNVYSEEQVKKDIEAIRNQTDVILVAMHFGEEYSFEVTERQRQIAEFLASQGVTIVIGHHPHVVQPVEMIENTLVIYSLGNFISAQRGIERLTGLIYSVDIVKEENENGSRVYLENQKASLTYTYSETTDGYRHNFKVYPYHRLTENLLPNWKDYYNQYMNIVLSNRQDIEKW